MVFLWCVRLEKQKAGKNREAERWRSREAKKHGKEEKQKSREAETQRSRETEVKKTPNMEKNDSQKKQPAHLNVTSSIDGAS